MERALLSLAADRRPVQGSGEDDRTSHSAEWDTLAAPQWPGVPEKAMLLSPSRCRALWRQFTSDTNFMVQQVAFYCITCSDLTIHKVAFCCINWPIYRRVLRTT